MDGLGVLPVATGIGLAMLTGALLLAFVRLARGPSVPDRVVALDLIAVVAAGMMALFAIALDQPFFLDAAIVLGLVAFLGTIAFAQYIARGSGR
jgi:multicomponent Na+:H+ antiporter subunit F